MEAYKARPSTLLVVIGLITIVLSIQVAALATVIMSGHDAQGTEDIHRVQEIQQEMHRLETRQEDLLAEQANLQRTTPFTSAIF